MLKNILSLIFICFGMTTLFAQSAKSTVKPKDIKRKIAIKTEELKQFEEKAQSFQKTLMSENQKDVGALKLMIEHAMFTKLQEKQHVSKTSVANNRSKRGSRAEKAQRYKQEKGLKTAGSKNLERENNTAKQQLIYERFAAIDEVSTSNARILNKLTLEFYDSIEKDLELLQKEYDSVQ